MPSSPQKLREKKIQREIAAGARRMAKHNSTIGLWTSQGAAAKLEGKTLRANPYTTKRDAEKGYWWDYGWRLYR